MEALLAERFTLLLPDEVLDELTETVMNKPHLANKINSQQLGVLRTILSELAESVAPIEGAIPALSLIHISPLWHWAKDNKEGLAYDSSAGFVLPNKAVRSPDASWVRHERLANLTPQQRERFVPLCPDFVVEVASPSDYLGDLQAKMEEYIANGAQLGWLLVPATRTITVYRPGEPVATLENATSISGDPVLPGFTLNLGPVWEPEL